jgi:uncharacterized membrane protein YbhN (UPF0104 family)
MRSAEQSEARPRPAAGRQRWLLLAKTTFGLALLAALLVWNDNGRKLLDVFAGFRPEFALALLLISCAMIWISCIKWGLFLRDRGVRISHARLFGLYLIGFFFNNFLPSSIGGDGVRAYMVGREIESQAASFASVLMERATGVLALIFLAASLSLLNPRLLANPIIAATVAGGLAGAAVAIALFFRPRLLQIGIDLLRLVPPLNGLAAKVERLAGEVLRFRHRHRLLLLSLLLSGGFHLLAGLNVYVSCWSIGFAPPALDIFVITPVILLLTMLPVSPNNIGWWEWCFSVLLLSAGATAAEGLAVGLTIRFVTMGISLIGGLLFLRWRSAPPPS